MEEDEKLIEGYKRYGRVWSEISKTLPGRTLNSIKNRFKKIKKETEGNATAVQLSYISQWRSIMERGSEKNSNHPNQSENQQDKRSNTQQEQSIMIFADGKNDGGSQRLEQKPVEATHPKKKPVLKNDSEDDEYSESGSDSLSNDEKSAEIPQDVEKQEYIPYSEQDGNEDDSSEYCEYVAGQPNGDKNILDELIKNMRMKKKGKQLISEKKNEKRHQKELMKNQRLYYQKYMGAPPGYEGVPYEEHVIPQIVEPQSYNPNYTPQNRMMIHNPSQMMFPQQNKPGPQAQIPGVVNSHHPMGSMGEMGIPSNTQIPPGFQDQQSGVHQRANTNGLISAGFSTQCCGSPVFIAPSCQCNQLQFNRYTTGPVNVGLVYRPPNNMNNYTYPTNQNIPAHHPVYQPPQSYRYGPH
jgi:hypothetical protein